jgi:hypothetical protein
MSAKAIEALRRLVDVAQKMNFVEEADLDEEVVNAFSTYITKTGERKVAPERSLPSLTEMMEAIEDFDAAVSHAESVLAKIDEVAQ